MYFVLNAINFNSTGSPQFTSRTYDNLAICRNTINFNFFTVSISVSSDNNARLAVLYSLIQSYDCIAVSVLCIDSLSVWTINNAIFNYVSDSTASLGIEVVVVVLCQDLVQVKMRNFSPF